MGWKIFNFQRLIPQRVLVSHREVLHEAKNNEVMKIFKKLPDQAYLLVRDPEPRKWFVRSHGLNQLRNFLRSLGIWTSICSIQWTGKTKYEALCAINSFVNKPWAQNFGTDGTPLSLPSTHPIHSKSFFLSLRVPLLVRNNTSPSTLVLIEIVKKEIFDWITGARWSNLIKAHPITPKFEIIIIFARMI